MNSNIHLFNSVLSWLDTLFGNGSAENVSLFSQWDVLLVALIVLLALLNRKARYFRSAESYNRYKARQLRKARKDPTSGQPM